MSEKIRIDDLASPVLSKSQRAALSYCETLSIDLQAESILAEAEQQTALCDFGAPDFQKRLVRLCEEWSNDEELTQLSKLSLRNKLLQHAKNRLLIQDVLQCNPEIHDVEISKPIIVAGLPRSGTTHLLNVMAADKRLRSLPLWESYEPVPLPSEKSACRVAQVRDDPRYKRCDQQWQMMQEMSPLLAAMHPMNPDHIHEELELMGGNFASYNYEWLAESPAWRDHYFAEDQTPHYDYMKTVLKILTWQDGDTTGRDTRWVLKCPQHLEQLPVLHSVFDDATVAITHRDPVSVIQSAITMVAYGQRTGRRKIDLGRVLSYWTDRIERLLRSCVRDRAIFPPSQSLDVLFHEFMENDMATVKQIYGLAELPFTENANAQITEHLREHPRGKHGQIIYDLEADFGASATQIRERFGFYLKEYPVKIEML